MNTDAPTNTRKRQLAKKKVKMVPHGPGGQMLRPAPKVRVRPRSPQARARGVRVVQQAAHPTYGPTKQNHPVHRVKPRTVKARAHGVQVVKHSAQHVRQVEKKQAQRKARKYITQNPVKGMQRSESNAIHALFELRQSNPKQYDKNLALAPLRKPDPLDVGLKGIVGGIKSGASHLHSSQNHLATISLPQSLATKNSGVSKKIGKALENASREATTIPTNVVPSTVHILKPAYQHPGDPKAYVKSAKRFGDAAISLPKEYVKAYQKKGLKGVEDTFVKYPLSTGLTLAPIPRAPGLAAGAVARRGGKVVVKGHTVLKIPETPRAVPRELPGTAMKVVDRPSRSYFKAKRQAKKPVKQVEDKHIQHRVDAEVALQEDLARRAQSETYKKTYKARKKVVPKKQARAEASQLAREAQDASRLEHQRNSYERLALLEKPKVRVGGPGKHVRDTSKIWFDPNKGKPGRGTIDKDGKLHTWNEEEATHGQMGFDDGKSENLIIRHDGTVTLYHGRAGNLEPYEIFAKVKAQDPRLKISERMERSENYKAALAYEQAQLAKASSPKAKLVAAKAKERAARKELTSLPKLDQLTPDLTGHAQQQLLRNTGHTIADYTRLEEQETHFFTLWEHHKAAAEKERAIGNEALAKQHDRMAEAANKRLTPIEGELEKLIRTVEIPKRGAQRAQLEADLKLSNYTNARRERQAIESNPSNLRLVKSGGKAQLFDEATKAMNAAERYNAKHNVTMIPKKVKGGYLVIPESAAKRFKAHEANTETGPVSAAFKAYNNLWRKNVLGTHTTWPAGNIGEAALRSAVERVGPTSYVRGYKSLAELKRIDPKAYEEMTGHATKGGHLKMQVHIPDETKMNITGYGPLADFARHVQKMRDKPVIRNVANSWDRYTHIIMGELSGKTESFFQTGLLGKELARSPLMDGHILKTSKAAIADAAKGMRETHNQIALGEAVDRMYGQYGKFSPFMRKLISHYTPFIAWTLNSLKWLGIYLPRDHPVLTATAASVQPYVDEWLKDKGLSAFVKGALPSFLQGSIPTKHGGHARFPTRYTPFAVAAGEPEDIASALLPQLSGAQAALQHGINWKGQALRNPDGTPLDPHQKEIYAALTILEGGFPGLQQTIGPATNYEKGARTPRKLVKRRSGKDILRSENPFSIVPKKKAKKVKAKSPFDGPSQSKSPFDSSSGKKEKSPFDP